MNSSTNPRKFAEKIAKLHQKEMEQTMAFEQIMAEVIVATRGPSGQSTSNETQQLHHHNSSQGQQQQSSHHLHINQTVSTSRAESLPNVNHVSNNGQNSIDLQSALSNLEEMKQHHGRIPGSSSRERRPSPSGLLNPRVGHHHQMHQVHQHQPRSITHSSDHHRRTSPASPYSTPYLSPPDTWRRTNSDSALHQSSLMADRTEGSASSFMPHVTHGQHHVSRRSPVHLGSSSLTNISHTGNGSVGQSTSGSWDVDRSDRLEYDVVVGQQDGHPQTSLMLGTMMTSSSLRPKSCDVPGITIYPSPTEEGGNGGNNSSSHHIPISANTGSLPDLTSFHFPAPLSTPIDVDDQSSSVMGAVSTASVNTHSSSSQFAFQSNNNNNNNLPSCVGSSNGKSNPIPPGSPYTTQRAPPSPYSSINSNPNSPFSPQSPLSALGYSPPGDPSHLTHDNILQLKEAANSMSLQQHLHHQQHVCYSPSSPARRSTETPRITVEGLAMDTSALSLESHPYPITSSHDSQVYNGDHGLQGQSFFPPSSMSHNQMGLNTGSGTPSEHSNSAPPSPTAHTGNHPHTVSPASTSPGQSIPGRNVEDSDKCFNHGFQTNVLQHQFEQFKMVNDFGDCEGLQMMPGSTGHSSSSSASSSTGGLYMNSGHVIKTEDGEYYGGNGHEGYEKGASAGFAPRNLPLSAAGITSSSVYSKSVISCAPSQYHMSRQGQQHPSTPQTPNSIPNIEITEPLTEDGLLREDFSKDSSSGMGSFDANDLFSSDTFKSDLPIDPIDFDGLQNLTDMMDSPSEERS